MSEIVDVWKTTIDGATCVHSDVETALEDVRGWAEGLSDGQSVEIKIEKAQMTASALDALPDFEGY